MSDHLTPDVLAVVQRHLVTKAIAEVKQAILRGKP